MKHILIILLILPFAVSSQSVTDHSYSSWNSMILDYQINSKVYLKNEAHFRRTNFLKDWQQLLIRPSLHYKATEGVDFAVGYSFIKNFKPSYNLNEHNVWEQVQLSHHTGKSKFKHRFRYEQRFAEQVIQQLNSNFITGDTDFKMRFRYRFTWEMPLFKIFNDKKISAVAFDEIWLNTDSGIVPKSLNQNWFYAGVSYQILKNTSLGFGYMNDYAPAGLNHFKNNSILQTTIKYHI